MNVLSDFAVERLARPTSFYRNDIAVVDGERSVSYDELDRAAMRAQRSLLALAATVASWLVIHGAITTALGVAFCVAAYVGHRKAQAAQETLAAKRPASVNG